MLDYINLILLLVLPSTLGGGERATDVAMGKKCQTRATRTFTPFIKSLLLCQPLL